MLRAWFSGVLGVLLCASLGLIGCSGRLSNDRAKDVLQRSWNDCHIERNCYQQFSLTVLAVNAQRDCLVNKGLVRWNQDTSRLVVTADGSRYLKAVQRSAVDLVRVKDLLTTYDPPTHGSPVTDIELVRPIKPVIGRILQNVTYTKDPIKVRSGNSTASFRAFRTVKYELGWNLGSLVDAGCAFDAKPVHYSEELVATLAQTDDGAWIVFNREFHDF